MKYNDRGEELPDDSQVEIPVKFRRPPSIQELIAMHVKAATQVERKMGKSDEEDFDDEDETDDVLTPYEIDAYAGEASVEIRKAEETQKVLDKLKGRKRGFAEKEAGARSDVSARAEVSGPKGAGSEVASGSKEKDSGAA